MESEFTEKADTLRTCFEDYLTSIYDEGFADYLSEEEPDRYNFELTQFLNLY
jgi:hypothetical protein